MASRLPLRHTRPSHMARRPYGRQGCCHMAEPGIGEAVGMAAATRVPAMRVPPPRICPLCLGHGEGDGRCRWQPGEREGTVGNVGGVAPRRRAAAESLRWPRRVLASRRASPRRRHPSRTLAGIRAWPWTGRVGGGATWGIKWRRQGWLLSRSRSRSRRQGSQGRREV